MGNHAWGHVQAKVLYQVWIRVYGELWKDVEHKIRDTADLVYRQVKKGKLHEAKAHQTKPHHKKARRLK